MKRIALIALIGLFLSTNVYATETHKRVMSFFDGNDVLLYLESCVSLGDGFYDSSQFSLVEDCQNIRGYIKGIFEGMSLSGEELGCFPDQLTPTELADAVYKWLKDRPEKLQLKGAEIVQEAAIATWPCEKTKDFY
jgi:hypothetical protein